MNKLAVTTSLARIDMHSECTNTPHDRSESKQGCTYLQCKPGHTLRVQGARYRANQQQWRVTAYAGTLEKVVATAVHARIPALFACLPPAHR